MLTSNVVIWSPLLNFKAKPLPPPPRLTTEASCNWLELPLVVQEQFFRRLVGYVYPSVKKQVPELVPANDASNYCFVQIS